MRSFSMTSRTTCALNSSEYLAAGMGSILSTQGKKNSPSPRNTTHPTPPLTHNRSIRLGQPLAQRAALDAQVLGDTTHRRTRCRLVQVHRLTPQAPQSSSSWPCSDHLALPSPKAGISMSKQQGQARWSWVVRGRASCCGHDVLPLSVDDPGGAPTHRPLPHQLTTTLHEDLYTASRDLTLRRVWDARPRTAGTMSA